MKKILIIIIALVAGFNLTAQQDTIPTIPSNNPQDASLEVSQPSVVSGTLDDANEAFAKGEYSKSVQIYEQILKEKGESAQIYYNIGNCYSKLNKIAPAILNYERALLLNPSDGDIRYNLEYINSKTVDKIEPVGEFFLVDWIHSLQNLFTTNQWSIIGITSFLLFIGCLFLFFFSRKIILKKIGFYASIGLLVLTIVGNIFAYNQKKTLIVRNTAIVFAPTVTIKSSPDNSGTDLFVLHEGVKVTIKSKLGSWNEIEIADGNVGWIKTEDIIVI